MVVHSHGGVPACHCVHLTVRPDLLRLPEELLLRMCCVTSCEDQSVEVEEGETGAKD